MYGGFGFKPKAEGTPFDQVGREASEKSGALTDRSQITDKSAEKAGLDLSKASSKGQPASKAGELKTQKSLKTVAKPAATKPVAAKKEEAKRTTTGLMTPRTPRGPPAALQTETLTKGLGMGWSSSLWAFQTLLGLGEHSRVDLAVSMLRTHCRFLVIVVE